MCVSNERNDSSSCEQRKKIISRALEASNQKWRNHLVALIKASRMAGVGIIGDEKYRYLPCSYLSRVKAASTLLAPAAEERYQ